MHRITSANYQHSRLRFSGEEVLAFLEEEKDDGDIDVFCPDSDDDLDLLEEGEEEVDNEVEMNKPIWITYSDKEEEEEFTWIKFDRCALFWQQS